MPAAGAGGFEDGIADVLGLEGVAEARAGGFAGGQAFEKVGHLMDEGVLVTDLQPRHPPFAHVGMVGVGDVDAAPAPPAALVAMLEVLQTVRIEEVPKPKLWPPRCEFKPKSY